MNYWRTLASYPVICGWSEDVYRDFLACQRGTLSSEEFHQKYQRQRTILSIDMTGLTISAMTIGELQSLLRIVDAQKVCIPVLKELFSQPDTMFCR